MSSIQNGPSAPETTQTASSKGVSFLGGVRKLSKSLDQGGLSTSNEVALMSKSQTSPRRQPKDEKKSPRPTRHTTMKELEKMLEEDALNLLNLKKEMILSKGEELEKAHKNLNDLRMQVDLRVTENSLKSRELAELNNRISQLREVAMADIATKDSVDDNMLMLKNQIDAVRQEHECETRTYKMQELMLIRLRLENTNCRKTTASTQMVLDTMRHELSGAKRSIESSKHELAEMERRLDKMIDNVKAVRTERTSKMKMLNALVTESEKSLAKVKEASGADNNQMDDSQSVGSAHAETASSHFLGKFAFAASPIAKAAHIHSKHLNDHENHATDGHSEFDDLKDSDPISRMTLAQIRELGDRFRTRDTRMQKLEALDDELKKSIASLKDKNNEISTNLQKTITKYQQLASSRQIYQEVDMKDAALAAARKECDECQEREERLRNNIESIKRSLPRFLTKLTRHPNPIPTEDQLPDVVLKLEEEISKLIKLISSAMMKEATQEDLQILSQQSGNQQATVDNRSEVAKLQSLPGFNRMTRALFFNLMIARPDVTDKNVRITVADLKGSKKAAVAGVPDAEEKLLGARGLPVVSSSALLADKDSDLRLPSATFVKTVELPTMDRDIVKHVAKLVVDRDAHKFAKKKVDPLQALMEAAAMNTGGKKR